MLIKNEALAFLYQAREYNNQNNTFFYSWRPWRESKFRSGIQYTNHDVFNFGDQFNFKSIDDLITEIEGSQEFDSESHEAKLISRLISKKEGYFLESLHSDLRKIEQHFLDYLQSATGPDRLYTIDVDGQQYRISPYSLFYIHPFFNGNDHTTIIERKNIIEQKLNEELEKRLNLENFLEPFHEVFKNQQRKELSGLIMLNRDDYVSPNAVRVTQNQQRFFSITRQLPQEIYGVVTKSVVGSKKEILTDSEIIDGAKEMLLKF